MGQYFRPFAIANLLLASALASSSAHALPAFARAENASCTKCHLNGSAPRLNEYGYMFRRAGFRDPSKIGNSDKEPVNFVDRFSAQVRFDYEVRTEKAPGADSYELTRNNFDVPSANLFPLVGRFMGNFGVWSEIEAVPAPHDEGVSLAEADLRYVRGSEDLFFNFRGGLIGPQGYGLADRGLLGGPDTPLINQLSPFFNQDALILPFGDFAQLGAELGLNYKDSHLTVAILNGFDGTTVKDGQAELNPALMNSQAKGHKDLRVQLDQWFGTDLEATAAYYTGQAVLLDPSGGAPWQNSFDTWRLYVDYIVLPSVMDIEAGGAYGTYQWINAGSAAPGGQANNKGASLAVLFYPIPHLTLEVRGDFNQLSEGKNARGTELVASLPYENNLFLFSYNYLSSDLTGQSQQIAAEWKFLY